MTESSTDRLTSDVGPFAMVPDWIIRAPISDRAVRLYAALGRYADREGEAYPSRRTLATALRTSPDSVDRATKELVDAGALEVDVRFDDDGDRTSNLYRLRLVAPEGVAAPLRPPPRTGAATRPQGCGDGSRTAAALTKPIERDQDQDQRAHARTVRVLTKVCHLVLDEIDAGRLNERDLNEEIKLRAAQARIPYDATTVSKARSSAEAQRRRLRRSA